VVPSPVARLAAASARPATALPPFFSDGLYRQYLKPGEIVVVVSYRGNAGMLFQACTGFYFRLAGGYINQSLSQEYPPQVEALADPSPVRIRQFQEFVRDDKVGAVIVEQVWAQPWMNVFNRVGMHGTSVGGVTIYQPAAD
jgi:ABC-type Zn uptake system ZnuABC Zn-binding protein ZnuA